MISFQEASDAANSLVRRMPVEYVPLSESHGRILAAEIIAGRDIPAHDLSIMDGYACRQRDLDEKLTVMETIPAGRKPQLTIGKCQCSRIMTGALVPDGADTVVMYEDAVETAGIVSIRKKGKQSYIRLQAEDVKKEKLSYIRLQAEDVKKGDTVLEKGACITPVVMAVLACEGYAVVPVYKRPVVGIIATGDELVEPSVAPAEFQIRNSNSYQLIGQVTAAGCIPLHLGIVRDNHTDLEALFMQAIAQCDVVLFSGGVSAGDFDFVSQVFAGQNVRIVFDGIAVKPGKPTVFGIAGERLVFGMPGNPVAAFVIFEMLVKPFLRRMMGQEFIHRLIPLKLAQKIQRKNSDRMEFIPVMIADDRTVRPVPYNGSAHIHAYTKAQGLVVIPEKVTCIDAGTVIDVMLF